MARTCKELFEGIPCTIIGNSDELIEGIAYRSDHVRPGDVFCCIVGLQVDGHSFAQDAIDRGARVLVVERKVYLADATDVTEVIVRDSRKAMAAIAARFYGNPSHDFSVVGITGTSGKSTTSYLVDHMVSRFGYRTGLINSFGISVAGKHRSSLQTTPESVDLQALLAEMRDAQTSVVTMEVSSHALDQKRTWNTEFAVCAFTNLTQEHLDYHKTFESYFEAKAQLFSQDYPSKRVINIDSAWGKELLRRVSAAGDEIITTGFDRAAQIHPVHVEYATNSTHIVLDVKGLQVEFSYPLVGRFNVENVMTAFGIGLALGYQPDAIAQTFRDAPIIHGRLEHINSKQHGGVDVYLDYAHTPDVLEKVIDSLSDLTSGRTIVVFGCPDNLERSKRPLMGRAALKADAAVVTSADFEGTTDQGMFDDIRSGMIESSDRMMVEPDRRRAIAYALSIAHEGDVILIAGSNVKKDRLQKDRELLAQDRAVAIDELEKVFNS